MQVELLYAYPIEIIVNAARTSHGCKYINKYTQDDEAFLKKLIENRHLSVFEHWHATFLISGCSQICMSQLTRHRTFNFTIKSKRYTLKKDIKNGIDVNISSDDYIYAETILNQILDIYGKTLKMVTDKYDINNDMLEYIVPCSYKTDIFLTADLRNLFNFFELRVSTKAHEEIRSLAMEMLRKLPENIYNLIYHYISLQNEYKEYLKKRK